MDALLTAITVWLSVNYGLPANFEQPRIERVPSIEMASLRYKGLLTSCSREAAAIASPRTSVEQTRGVIAIYNDQTKTIYLSDKWKGDTPGELSVLVHEMVHHLQRQARMSFECPAEREKLAYDAQDKWLGLFRRNLESEFKQPPRLVDFHLMRNGYRASLTCSHLLWGEDERLPGRVYDENRRKLPLRLRRIRSRSRSCQCYGLPLY